jgi:hypothetical protein
MCSLSIILGLRPKCSGGEVKSRMAGISLIALFFTTSTPSGRLTKSVTAEIVAGIGGENLRFYTPNPTCDFYSCTDYASSNHFMGDVGEWCSFPDKQAARKSP